MEILSIQPFVSKNDLFLIKVERKTLAQILEYDQYNQINILILLK